LSCYCEVCGREVERSQCRKVVVEGSVLNVCPQCYARLVGQGKARPYVEERKQREAPKPVSRPPRPRVREEYDIVEDYARRIREARERMGLTRDTLAAMLGVKVSVVRRIEEGALVPPVDLAEKIEKTLKVKLLSPVEEEEYSRGESREWNQTLGDVAVFKE